MKRIISFILALLITISIMPAGLAAEDLQTCTIQVIRDKDEAPQKIECRNVDGSVYLKAEDVAKLTDSLLITHGGKVTYFKDLETHEAAYIEEKSKENETTYWVPAAETLELLNTFVCYMQGTLILEDRTSRRQEISDLAKEIFGEEIQRLALTSTRGLAGEIGLQASMMYKVISTGDYVDAALGKVQEENYKETFALLLASGEKQEKDELVATIQSANKWNEKLHKLDTFAFGKQSLSDFMKQTDNTNVTAGRVLSKTYSSISNAFDSFFPEEYPVSGLSFNDQLEVIQYMRGYADAYSYYVDALDNLLVSTYLEDPYEWGSKTMIASAKNIVNYYQSEDAEDIFMEFINQEIKTILTETVNNRKIQGINKDLGLTNVARNVAIAKILLETFYEYVGFPLTELMHSVEIDRCLTNIQTTAKKLYYHYMDDMVDPIRAKSALIIYLRCSEVWADLYEPHVPDGQFKAYRELIEKYRNSVAEIDSAFLLYDFRNQDIPYYAMITEGPAVLEEGTWDNLVDFIVDPDQYVYLTRIETHNDGTIELYGGFPDAEIEEYYKGTYVQENGNLYRLKITGGMNTITGGAYEQEIYETLVRMTVLNGVLYVDHLEGDEHWFFSDTADNIHKDKTFDKVPSDITYSNYITNFDPKDIKPVQSGIQGKWICKIPADEGGPYVHVLTIYDTMSLELTGGTALNHLTDQYSGSYFHIAEGVCEVKLNGTGREDPDYTMRRLFLKLSTNKEKTLLQIAFEDGDPHWVFEGEPKLFVREGMDIYEATRPAQVHNMMLPEPRDSTQTDAVLQSPKKSFQYGPISFDAPSDLTQKDPDHFYLVSDNLRVEIEKLEGLARETTLKDQAEALCRTYRGSELTAWGDWYYYIHHTGTNTYTSNYFYYSLLVQAGEDLYLIDYSGIELGKEAFLDFLKTLKIN